MRTRSLVVIALIFSVSSCSSEETSSHPSIELTVRGLNGSEKRLSWNDLTKLEATEGDGGYVTTVGSVTSPSTYRGVTLERLVDQVGGLRDQSAIRAMASDDYSTIFSATQIRSGRFPSFDSQTGDPLMTTTSTPIIAYERDGQPLEEDQGGPLRIALISEDTSQVTEGHFWVREVVRLEVVPMTEDWSLTLSGAREESIDWSFFEAGAAPGCHLARWTDNQSREWAGIPLWLLVGWVDDENMHAGRAFNRELASKGYTVDIVSNDGTRLSLTSTEISENNSILLANTMNGDPLESEHFPLRLVGDGVPEDSRIGQVTSLVLHLP